MPLPTEVRIGCSSWTSPAWAGRFYRRGLPDVERLSAYARRFDCVEVDATYYAMLPEAVVAGWGRRTPESFRFTLKCPREFLDPRTPARAESRAEFFRRAAVLGPKLAGVLFQFPPWFRPPKTGDAGNWGFLESVLRSAPGGVRVAVELRDSSWFAPDRHGDLRKLLEELRVPLAWSYLTYLDVPPDETGDWIYLRFIGDHETVPAEQHGRTVVDRSGPMRTWADRLRAASERVRSAYAFFNNHFAGYAPASAEEFRDLVGLPPRRSVLG